jgi:hypothetical protein
MQCNTEFGLFAKPLEVMGHLYHKLMLLHPTGHAVFQLPVIKNKDKRHTQDLIFGSQHFILVNV